MDYLRRCWAEINLDAIKENCENYRKFLGNKTELLCVVKAFCYGHSDKIVVPFLENELNVKWFAVSNISEGKRLRDMGIKGEILILGYTPWECADELVKLNIIQACTEFEYAKKLSSQVLNKKVRIHCAVDTGMTRIGLCGNSLECVEEIKKIMELENISLEGIFSHYAVADEIDEDSIIYTKSQTQRILEIDNMLKNEGIALSQLHFLNSAGGIYYYNEFSTLARLGIILYGLYPNPLKKLPFKLAPALTLKAVVAQVKYIDAKTTVSYGRTFTAKKKMKICTVTAGYADGYPRALSNVGEVLIGGKRCKITGRICMDQFMCDVSEVGDVKVGDEVILIGCDGENTITADDIAKLTNTIGYEIVCGISNRVPRISV